MLQWKDSTVIMDYEKQHKILDHASMKAALNLRQFVWWWALMLIRKGCSSLNLYRHKQLTCDEITILGDLNTTHIILGTQIILNWPFKSVQPVSVLNLYVISHQLTQRYSVNPFMLLNLNPLNPRLGRVISMTSNSWSLYQTQKVRAIYQWVISYVFLIE